jgi:tetratricopeptide (TPR) repeat protein
VEEKKKNKPEAEDAAPAPQERAARLRLVSALVIAAFCFIIYSNTFHAPFLFDDQINIYDNPYIRVTELSPTQLWRAAVQDGFQLRFLSNLSFGLDYYFHGLNLFWMHAENISIHVLAAILLYFIVHHLVLALSKTKFDPKRPWAASLVAALAWAAHPAHAQAVTYLVQRQTTMAVAAMLASFLAFIKARQSEQPRQRRALYGLAVLAFLVAAGSKEIGWTTPAYWILFELLLRGRKKMEKKERDAMVQLFAILVFSGFVALVVLTETGVLAAYFKSYQEIGYGPGQRLLTETRVLASYLATTFFPHPVRLALDHDVSVSTSPLSPWTTMPALLLIAAMAAVIVIARRRKPLLSFLGLGLFIALAPESTLIPVDLMNDHRLYLASIFLLPPAAAAAGVFLRPRRAYPLLVLSIIFMGLLTLSRNRDFSSTAGIWNDTVRKSPGLPRPWSNYCADLCGSRAFAKALTACDRAIAFSPPNSAPYLNKAIALMSLGRKEEAGKLFAKTAADFPDDASAQFNYGGFLELNGRVEEAMKYYRRSLDLDPFQQKARINLARDLRQADKLDEAMETIKWLPKFFPDSPEAWMELARAAIWAKDFNLAVDSAVKARELDPRGNEPLLLMATAYLYAGKNGEAGKAFQAVLKQDPLNQRAWMGLVRVDLDRGDPAAAAFDAAQVRRSGPLSPELEAELRELEKEISARSRPAAP